MTLRYLLDWALLRCCVTDVLCCRGADGRDCCVVCCLFVCWLSGVSLRDVQGGVAYITGTGKFSAEHCTFSGNTAYVSLAAWALLRVTLRFH